MLPCLTVIALPSKNSGSCGLFRGLRVVRRPAHLIPGVPCEGGMMVNSCWERNRGLLPTCSTLDKLQFPKFWCGTWEAMTIVSRIPVVKVGVLNVALEYQLWFHLSTERELNLVERKHAPVWCRAGSVNVNTTVLEDSRVHPSYARHTRFSSRRANVLLYPSNLKAFPKKLLNCHHRGVYLHIFFSHYGGGR